LPDPGDKTGRLATLAELGARRQSLAETIELEEIWQTLEGEGLEFDYELLAGLAFGHDPSPDELSATRRAILTDGLRFAFSPKAAIWQTAEEVEKKRLIKARKKAHQEFVSLGAEWLSLSLAKRVAPEPPEAEKVTRLLVDLAVNEDQAHDPRTAKELLREAGLPTTGAGAFEALVAVGEFQPRENLDLRRLDVGHAFTDEEIAEARRLVANFQFQEPRLNLTDLPVITIDAEGAKEFDDGVSLTPGPNGSWSLGLHIADVAAVITPGSLLDETARRRAASIYLPDAKMSMLPEELTEKILSLKLGLERPAFSLLVELDRYGEPQKYSFHPSIIKVGRQMSFNEADELLARDAELQQLNLLGQTLLNRRQEFGGQNLTLPQLNIRLAPDGQILLEKTNWDTPARLMVGEMMVLANHLAAEALAKDSLACPYRYQEKPRGPVPSLREPRDEREALAQDLSLRRQLGRSGVSLNPSPHWGLGLASYTQFTSPIRRYADLLVARQLRTLADPGLTPYNHSEMTNLAFEADEKHRAIKRAQNTRIRYYLTLYLSTRIGEEFTGLIFERQESRARVCLTDFMLELDLFKLPQEVRPGREARLRLAQADPQAQVLRFEYVSLVGQETQSQDKSH
jgi:exoribonuclease-2